MKILSAEQIRQADRFTIEHEPVSSFDLMERAAAACYRRIVKLIRANEKIAVFCGMGNNGGDGLAITRMLIENGFDAGAFVIRYTDKFSEDAGENYRIMKEKFPDRVHDIFAEKETERIIEGEYMLVIDALLGTGVNRAMEGLLADITDFVNNNFSRVISIDIPSGLQADAVSGQERHIIRSTLTLSLQLPKLAFLLPGNEQFVPEFELVDIGILHEAIDKQESAYYYITKADIALFLKKRNRFSHKGNFGHALLLAGSSGKSGAAVIAAKACLRSGAGLLTVHSTKETLGALLQHLPEAMGSADADPLMITELHQPEKYDAIAFGPGAGTGEATATALKKLLQYYSGKLVIDADGLNILAENRTWLEFLPQGTILTPHPKEFERLTEKHNDDDDRLLALKKFSMRHNCIVVLKGAFTATAMPDGNVCFNSSGNAGLAKGGTGDGLTGIILGLLARGYNAPQAALTGVFVHGFAADLLVKNKSMESILISDVIELLPESFRELEENAEV